MKVAVVIAALALGCGGEAPAAREVTDGPLSGIVSGRPFVAARGVAFTAHAESDRGPVQFVNVTREPVGCADARTTPTTLQAQVVWATGEAYDLGEDYFGTIVHEVDGVTTVSVTGDGRVEVIDAPPDIGGIGTLRLRLRVDEEDDVAGLVEAVLCD